MNLFSLTSSSSVQVCRKITIGGAHTILMPITDDQVRRKAAADHELGPTNSARDSDSDVVWKDGVAYVAVRITVKQRALRIMLRITSCWLLVRCSVFRVPRRCVCSGEDNGQATSVTYYVANYVLLVTCSVAFGACYWNVCV